MTTPPPPSSPQGILSETDRVRSALDREVAINVLPSRLAIDRDFVERFEHEARTAGRLEQPNIVPIYRVGRAGPNGDVIYFVIKLLRGQSLSGWKRWPPAASRTRAERARTTGRHVRVRR